LADEYEPPWPNFSDAEKFYFPIALARLERYGSDDSGVNFGDGTSLHPPLRYGILDYQGQNPRDKDRLPSFVEKNPFHFIFLGLSRLLMDASEAPAMKANRAEFLRRGLDRDDNFSMLYAEGTENHIAMTRTAGYIYAAEAAKEPEQYPEALELKRELREWMLRWARELYRTGDAEWNSTIYTAFNLAGWLNVYDYTAPEFEDDPALHETARAVLDFYALQMALHFTGSQLGGAEMRGSGRVESYLKPSATSPYVAWLWFGYPDGGIPDFQGSAPGSAIYAALSHYRPPAAVLELAHSKFEEGAYFRFGSPGYLMDRLGETQRKLYIGQNFSLGSATVPVGGWTSANWQIINWKLLAADGQGDTSVMMGNGGYRSLDTGTGRNPWDQFAQHRSVLVQMSFVPENAESIIAKAKELVLKWQQDWAEDFYARFPDPDIGGHGSTGPVKWQPGELENASRSRIYFAGERVQLVHDSDVVFFEMGPVRVAVRSLFNPAPEHDTDRVIEDRGEVGSLSGLLLEVAGAEEHADFHAFRSGVLRRTSLEVDPAGVVEYRNLDGEDLRFEFAHKGAYKEPEYDMGYGPRSRVAFIQEVEWKQPKWPQGEGHGRVPRVFVDGVAVEPLPPGWLIDGPGLTMRDGRFKLRSKRSSYEVDYSGERPVFREKLF
jgi:hypothetical protein